MKNYFFSASYKLLLHASVLANLYLLLSKSLLAEDIVNMEEQVELCNSCHGEDGAEPIDKSIPIIAGQSFYYLYVQLKDLKSKLRENEIMNPIVEELDKKTMKSLALFYSEKQWPTNNNRFELSKDENSILLSFESGQCTVCHMGQFEGNNSDVPKLAGQNFEYLYKTMLDYKNKIRMNAPPMSSLMVPYLDEDIKAMSEYLANL